MEDNRFITGYLQKIYHKPVDFAALFMPSGIAV
jgi:hypothetical protein